jgi:hypothetical protein
MPFDTTRRTATVKHARTLGSLLAAGALLAVPASGLAAKPAHTGKAAKANACRAHNMPFNVSGTFVSGTADDVTTAANEGTVTLLVTSANRHARKSGELTDMDAVKKGVQPKGSTYTVATTDAYVLKLNDYAGTDTVSAGDRVHVRGKVALTPKRCATAAASSVADRYGAVDVKKVTISDRDADA